MTNAVPSLASTVAREMGLVLSRPPLDTSDDFFVCGGDSLRAVELITRLANQFSGGDSGRSTALGSAMLIAVFEDPTPETLAGIIAEELGR